MASKRELHQITPQELGVSPSQSKRPCIALSDYPSHNYGECDSSQVLPTAASMSTLYSDPETNQDAGYPTSSLPSLCLLPQDDLWFDLDPLEETRYPFADGKSDLEWGRMPDISESNLVYSSNGNDPQHSSYTEALEDADIEKLFNGLEDLQPQEPPSSIIRAFDHSPRSVEIYDPALQYSPVPKTTFDNSATSNDDTLDYEVDWAQLWESSDRANNNTDEQVENAYIPSSSSPNSATSLRVENNVIADKLLRPFKTFFHIQEMLDHKRSMFRHSTSAVFELFARVIHSSRERFEHKQYFEIGDLFRDSLPLLSGTLSEWNEGGHVDVAARVFLNMKVVGRKCYCRCRLIADSRSDMGWSVQVIEIREIQWKSIEVIVNHLGRDDLARSYECT